MQIIDNQLLGKFAKNNQKLGHFKTASGFCQSFVDNFRFPYPGNFRYFVRR